MAQPDFSDGSMIALYPPPAAARKLAIFGGLPAKDLHLTVAYTGDASARPPRNSPSAARSPPPSAATPGSQAQETKTSSSPSSIHRSLNRYTATR